MSYWKSCLLLIIFCVAPTILAQADCPTIVQDALDAAGNACAALSRNQACYGNVLLQAIPREGVSDLVFEQPGDIVDIANIQSLQLSSMSLTEETWGISMLQLQARVSGTLPGQSVTFVLFGDVQIANTVNEIPVTMSGAVDVVPLPNAKFVTLASLASGQEVTANGRLEDSSWARVLLPDDENMAGWVQAESLDGDVNALTVIDPDTPNYGPMQAFYFRSGVADRPCDEAPDSGILIQTTQGAASVNFSINEVHITLGSTAYLQAGGGFMTVSVLEGSASVEAFGVIQVVPAGTVAQIPLDANGLASGAPTAAQPYVSTTLTALPITLLPQTIITAAPLTSEQIAALNVPDIGPWRTTWDFEEVDLGCMSNFYGLNGNNLYIDIEADGTISWNSITLHPVGVGVYEGSARSTGDFPSTQTYRLVMVSPTRIVGQDIWSVDICTTVVNNFYMELQPLFPPTPSSEVTPQAADQGTILLSGDWCPQPSGCTETFLPTTIVFTAEEEGAFLTLDYGTSAERYSRTEPGVYTWSEGSSSAVLHVLASDHFTIEYDFGTGTTSLFEWRLLEAQSGDAASEDIIPTAGIWQITWEQNEVDTGQCTDTFANGEVSLTVYEDGSLGSTVFPPLPNASPGVYILEQGTDRYTLRVLSAESMEGDYEVFAFNCTFTNHFQMTFLRAS